MPAYTVPGLDPATAEKACTILQDRLVALNDLHLTLKHVHWNVVGEGFIAVHKMIDPQVETVRLQADAVAERIAAMGGEPWGTPGAIVRGRTWDDYDLGRGTVPQHLVALDAVYDGLVKSHRAAFEQLGDLDQVSHDMLVAQTLDLEQFQWFVRAHLEDTQGRVTAFAN